MDGVRSVRRRISRAAMFAILSIVAVVMLYPFWFMTEASFRSYAQYLAKSGFSLDSWASLFDVLPVVQQLVNSTLVTVSAVAIILVVSTMGGFAFAKLGFPGRSLILIAIIGGMMIPLQSIIIPEFVNIAQLGLINQFPGAILVYAGARCAVRDVPDDHLLPRRSDRAHRGVAHRRCRLPPDLPARDGATGQAGAGDRCRAPVHPDLGRPPGGAAVPADARMSGRSRSGWQRSRARGSSTSRCSWRGRWSARSRRSSCT